MAQRFSLKWKNYAQTVVNSFATLQANDEFTDVTLSCDGQRIKTHKILLSACSDYFKEAFRENACPHPIVILIGVDFADLEVLVKFMYNGQASVAESRLSTFLQTAELLQIKGLSDIKGEDELERMDTKEELKSLKLLNTMTEMGGRFLCIICKKHFKNKNVLYNHRSVYHRNHPMLNYGSTDTIRVKSQCDV